MNRKMRLLGGLFLVIGLILAMGLAQTVLAAGPDWSDNFNGGAQQTWTVVDQGDDSTYLVQNNRYELHTESTGGGAKALVAYVNASAANCVVQSRVQQVASGDNFLAYLMARTTVATGSAYLLGASSDGTHFWFGKLVVGAYQQLAPTYIEAVSYDVTDFHLKFMVFGSTLLGKVWSSSGSEPDHWQIKATDSSYSSGAGGVMIATYPTLSWNVVQAAFDDVSLSTPSEVWVDDGWAGSSLGDMVGGHTFGYDAFATIQAAINAVNAGGTVHVAAGTYNERLNISKSLDLRGAQYGIDPTPGGARTVPANESTIDLTGLTPVNPNILVEIADGVSNVTIAGFTLIGSPTLHWSDEAVIRCWDNGITVQDNIMDGYTAILYKGPGNTLTVSRNRITANKTGIVVQSGPTSGVTVSGNSLTRGGSPAGDESAIYLANCSNTSVTENVATGWLAGRVLHGSAVDHLNVSGNTFTGNRDGLSIFNGSTFITIEDNNLSSNTRYGINIKGQDISITNNSITNNGDSGINVDQHVIDTLRVVIDHNTITGNTNYGLKVVSAQDIVDAEHNYWGSIVPAEVAAEVSGTADYQPWCNSDFTVCTYTWPVHNITQGTYHLSIQAAHDAASPGDVIEVKDGTYNVSTEPAATVGLVNIYKQITIKAEDDGNSVRPLIDASGRDGVFKIHVNALTGGQIVIEGFEIFGDKTTTDVAITALVCDTATPTKIIIRDNYIHGMSSGFDAWGWGGCASAEQKRVRGIEITGNTFSDLGVDGVTQGFGVMLEDLSNWANAGNTFAAKVEGNVFENIYDGTAGDFGVGVVIPRADAANGEAANVRIASNIFTGAVSVDVALTAGDVTDTEITNNNLGNSKVYGVLAQGISNGPVDASGNWFGSADPATVKAAVTANVDYTPWLAVGTDTSTDPGFQGDFSTLWVDDDSPQTGTTGRIQEGINLVSGSTVNVAAGTYTEQVLINENVDLIGAGEASTTILAPATRTGAVTEGAYVHDYLLAAYAASGTIDVRVEGFTLDINGQNKTTGTARLDGVFFRDVKDAGGLMAGLFSSTIHNFAATPDYESWGLAVYGNSLLTVDDNDISHYTRDGLIVVGDGTDDPNVMISGNTITGSATGLNGIGIMDGATGTVTGNIVTGNTRSAPWAGVGIGVWSDGLIVTYNQVDGNFYGISIFRADGTTVSNNTLTDNLSRAISLDNADNNTVSRNTITGPVAGTDDVAIGLSNTSTGNMIGGATLADGNIITMATSGYWAAPPVLYAIWVDGSVGAGSNTIQYNTVTGGKRGIQVDGGNTGTTTIANNTISNTPTGPEYPTFGIGVNGGSVNIIANTLNNTVRPIEAWGATNLSIADNTINNSTFAAINLGSFSGTATVDGNTIHGLADASAIWAQASGAGLSITDNIIYDISGTGAPGWAGRGIQINSAAVNANIEGNELYNITGFAAVVIDTGATGAKINNNYIHNNEQGVVANAQTAEFNGNIIVNNRWGIDLNSAGATFVLRNNTIAGNNGSPDSYGLSAWAGTADAEYNWWGDATGPFDLLGTFECSPGNCSADATQDVNLDGLGNKVSENVDYCPWLDGPPSEAGTQLYLDPAFGSILNDNTATQTYTVRIANAVDLYGYQFVVTFDPANVECTAAAFDGSFFPTDNKSMAAPGWNATIDNVAGKVYFARTLLNPEPAKSGSGPLATLTFRGKSGATAGQYKLDFEQVKLSDIDTNVLPVTAQFGWLELHDTGSLSGSVDVQGRANESGGVVTIMSSTGYTATLTITAADGSWSFTNIPAGDYQVNIEMARYLDAQAGDASLGVWVTVNAGSTTTLTKVKLLGGDANDDDVIDISDAAIIGGEFGKTSGFDPRADINADGMVDILDLVLMGGNYSKTSPVPWTPWTP